MLYTCKYFILLASVSVGTATIIKRENEDKTSDNTEPTIVNVTSEFYNDVNLTRSCIFCNNIVSDDCNDPQNKLISSIVCKNADDVCYSMHTPFGVIDRGCYDVNQNLETYVCSCDLCNHLPIEDLPHMFPDKRGWLNDVIEMSRTINYRKTVFKEMFCVRCEANASSRASNVQDNANCFGGNVGFLPYQDCNKNEICGIKSIKEDYIWRGCIDTPRYNDWWSFCNTDLCNYDIVGSLYLL